MAKGLKRNFPSVFEHLENVCAIKDMQTNDSRIGESPFSCLAVTKDYKMNVHRNRNDFSYGFFLWLGESGKFYIPMFILFHYDLFKCIYIIYKLFKMFV